VGAAAAGGLGFGWGWIEELVLVPRHFNQMCRRGVSEPTAELTQKMCRLEERKKEQHFTSSYQNGGVDIHVYTHPANPLPFTQKQQTATHCFAMSAGPHGI
jgi:hypothetical protein